MVSNTPLVSFCIFTYNQETFVENAVRSALQQTYPSIEIIISDDCSTDSTCEIIKKIVSEYKGIHKVIFVQNTTNLGLVPHINNVFSKYVKGKYIILAAGDDISFPTRVSDTVFYLEKYQVSGILFPIIRIDKNGHEFESRNLGKTTINKLSKKYFKKYSFMVNGTGLAIKKQIISNFGLLNNNCPTEDSTLRLRCMLSDGIIYVSKPGIQYRIHGSNMSSISNIFKLDTGYIAEQYRTDVQTAFKNKQINFREYKLLLLKIEWYKYNRKIAKNIQKSKNPLLRLKMFAVNFFYRTRMSCIWH